MGKIKKCTFLLKFMPLVTDKSTMKKSNYWSLMTVFLFYSSQAFSDSGAEGVNNYGEMIHSLKKVPQEVKKSGVIELPCVSCTKVIEVNKRLELKNEEQDLGVVSFERDDLPVVLHFLRTKNSPRESVLHFKNEHSICSKTYSASNPVVNNGDVLMGCLMSKTVYEEQKLQLDFKNWPAPKEGEEQIIEVRLIKPRVSEKEYLVEAEVVKGESSKTIKVEKDKKFWSQGFNLNFSEKEGKR